VASVGVCKPLWASKEALFEISRFAPARRVASGCEELDLELKRKPRDPCREFGTLLMKSETKTN
jgi:hypothetical protein